jgi:uncharacterized coiled-coil DUF342 family protein
MQQASKWTKEEVRTLNTLRSKKVGFKYIAKVLDRTEMSCRSKAYFLDNPDYEKKHRSKKRTSSRGQIKTLQNEVKVYKGKIADLIREKNELTKQLVEAREVGIEFSKRHAEAEGVIKAFQLNIRSYEQRMEKRIEDCKQSKEQ